MDSTNINKSAEKRFPKLSLTISDKGFEGATVSQLRHIMKNISVGDIEIHIFESGRKDLDEQTGI